MSTLLQDQAVAFVRQTFSLAEVFDVLPYSGEFAATEIVRSSFRAPAILIGVLGWQAPGSGDRIQHDQARTVSLAAFVVADQADRVLRMRTAMSLCGKLDLALARWQPQDQALPAEIAAPQSDVWVENLYGRDADKKGVALWLVRWRQCVLPKPGEDGLYDWLSLDIESTVRAMHAQDEVKPDPPPLEVTHDLKFQQDTPPTD